MNKSKCVISIYILLVIW